MNEQQAKAALKEALKEWMDDKFASFGKWTFMAVGTFFFGLVVYALLALNGWHRLPPH